MTQMGVTELRAHHGHFRTVQITRVVCVHCGWESLAKSMGGAAKAARIHVETYPDHQVLTRRIQEKVTKIRKVTVLR